MNDFIKGVAITAIVPATVYLFSRLKSYAETKRIYQFLKDNTDNQGYRFRSTQTIASNCNLTMDRVRALCSKDKRIHQSTGKDPDMWGLAPGDDSFSIFDIS